jgi:hypothetical protein
LPLKLQNYRQTWPWFWGGLVGGMALAVFAQPTNLQVETRKISGLFFKAKLVLR